MKERILKKVVVALIVISMFVPYLSGLVNLSIATSSEDNWKTYFRQYLGGNAASEDPIVYQESNKVTGWTDFVKTYLSHIAYTMNNKVQSKWMFLDTRENPQYENLHCIRSGCAQDETYYKYNMYTLKEEQPEIYNELFKGNKFTDAEAEKNYKHILWAAENFYLTSSKDETEDRQVKLEEYNSFISGNSNSLSILPYGIDDKANLSLYEINSNKTQSIGNYNGLTKNEVLIKTIQNEILLRHIIQTYDRSSDLSKVYDVTNATYNSKTGTWSYPEITDEKIVNYAHLISDKFDNINNSSNYDINNLNKLYRTNPEEAKVQLRAENNTVEGDVSNSFFIKNKFGANVISMTVKLDDQEIQNYTVLNKDGQEITNYLDEFSTARDSELEFKLRINDTEIEDSEIKIEFKVEYDLVNVTLFMPENKEIIRDSLGNQLLINITKEQKVEEVGIEGQIKRVKYFDLALTKQIASVNDYNYMRLHYVDSEALLSGDSTNARYVMSKKPVYVEPGDTVTYRITIFNEGEVDGYAEEVKDYLPKGLEFIEPEFDENNQPLNKNAKYGWEYAEDGNTQDEKVIRTRILQNNEIKAFDGEFVDNKNTKELWLECKVSEDLENNTILDNRAEISLYSYEPSHIPVITVQRKYADEEGVDRDSIQNSVLNDSNKDVRGLIDEIEDLINSATNFDELKDDKNKLPYEDDDDIERLIVKEDKTVMDLALRKWISNVDGKEYNREPSVLKTFEQADGLLEIGQRLMAEKETIDYDNPKDAIVLVPGSEVTYKIAIFNEGTTNAFAQEVTDYLPKGLEFVENNAINNANGWVATKNADGTTTVKTDILSREKGHETTEADARNSNQISWTNDTYSTRAVAHKTGVTSHKVLEIVCKVSDDVTDGKYLTNRTEITKYGYVNKNGDFIEANEVGIDRDSEQDTINPNKVDLDLDNWYTDKYLKLFDNDTPSKYFPGVQDDDDFETVLVKVQNGEYSVRIKKVSLEDENKTIEGAIFNLALSSSSEIIKTSQPTDKDGITTMVENAAILQEGEDRLTITEKYVPEPYKLYDGNIELIVAKKLVNGKYTLDEKNTKVNGKNVKFDIKDNVITIIVPNPEKEFDLSLHKFITSVNGSKLEGDDSRAPKVDLSTLINGDPKKNGEKTATYIHTKDPVLVNPTDIVEYTFRIYNEGDIDAYANRVIDDVPEGVTMIAPEYNNDGTPLNKNAKYRWKMFREMTEADKDSSELANKEVLMYNDKLYIETEKPEEAVLISSDYLSMENGIRRMEEENKEENPNLIPAFDGKRLYYKGINVEYKVQQARTKDTIITNHAQISEHQSADGTPVTDRDSTPNKWVKDEDDQDIENLKVNWFDLALHKWVSSTIVTEDGKTKEYASGHTQDDKEKIVNVTVAKDKLNKTVVKFKWTLKVENQSPIPGYATGVADYIPEGLRFLPEDNNGTWTMYRPATANDKPEDIVVIRKQNYVKTDKPEETTIVVTDELKDTLLNQNDTAEVTLILTWINGENNLGAKVNYAEINEDFNAYGAPDIDSTPNNFTGKPVEDDEDVDEVRLNVRTGSGLIVEYIAIVVGVLAIIATGTILVKKNVLDKEF